ncbi:hypothetical protein SDC9_186243 [bioreactor metagenome]|uniref:Uncharacterized protein n=1 Tax=bioreactor metagenome TaxID=1076179 RepID=A0A645HI60_9ZZZZ
MKNRNSKKNIASRIAEILRLAHQVTGQGKHCVFVDYSGHVDSLEIRIHLGGWFPNRSDDIEFRVWLPSRKCHFNNASRTFCELSIARAKLKSLLR